jgi:transcriptional antiterminator RfaH
MSSAQSDPSNPADSGESPFVRWYVGQCNVLKERQAAHALRDHLDLEVFVPEVKRRYRGAVQQMLLFPGYIFVKANLQEGILSNINSMPGIVRLLTFGESPQAVDDSLVEAIRERVSQVNAGDGIPSHSFRPGDLVQLKDGPLKGMEAVFVGPMTPSARVKVLLEMLGRQNEVKVDVEWLEHAANATQGYVEKAQERRTRGRGRKINTPAIKG